MSRGTQPVCQACSKIASATQSLKELYSHKAASRSTIIYIHRFALELSRLHSIMEKNYKKRHPKKKKSTKKESVKKDANT